MGVAAHLGIALADYDARIRTFIPHYEEMLAEAATALQSQPRAAPLVVDLGTGTGALAARCRAAIPRMRIVGIDSDAGMLDMARRRLGPSFTAVTGSFRGTALPRCDAITASFALHHVRTRRAKGALYGRCFAALRSGGRLVNADCCPSSDRRVAATEREAWRTHLRQSYSTRQADQFLRAWAKEDVYLPLRDELTLLQAAGFRVDVTWRRDGFAVLLGVKR